MTQNLHNAVIHLGHQNGCVTLWTPNLPHPSSATTGAHGPSGKRRRRPPAKAGATWPQRAVIVQSKSGIVGIGKAPSGSGRYAVVAIQKLTGVRVDTSPSRVVEQST